MKKHNIFLVSLIIALLVSCIKSKNNNEEFILNNNEKTLLDFYIHNKYEFEKNEKKIDSLRDFLLSQRGQKFISKLDNKIKNETNPAQKLNMQTWRNSFDVFLFNNKSLKAQIGSKEKNEYFKNTPNGFLEFLKNNYNIEDYKNDYEINYKTGIIILTINSKSITKSFRYNGKTFIEL